MAHVEYLDGPGLHRWAKRAVSELVARRSEINKLNVFPVPDADTGSNMAHTMETALAEVEKLDATSRADVSAVASALAVGSVKGARGNSGVVLSQVLRGLAQSVSHGLIDGTCVIQALDTANTFVRKAITEPVEGTVITVLRAAAVAAQQTASSRLSDVVTQATAAAQTALAKTPSQLPALREAGVVDAGGKGLVVLLESLRAELTTSSATSSDPTTTTDDPATQPHNTPQPPAHEPPPSPSPTPPRTPQPDNSHHIGSIFMLGQLTNARIVGAVGHQTRTTPRHREFGQPGELALLLANNLSSTPPFITGAANPGPTEIPPATTQPQARHNTEEKHPPQPAQSPDHDNNTDQVSDTQTPEQAEKHKDQHTHQHAYQQVDAENRASQCAETEEQPRTNSYDHPSQTADYRAGQYMEVMFFIEDADLDEIRRVFKDSGDSLIIAPITESSGTVHIHTTSAAAIVELAYRMGTVSNLHFEVLPTPEQQSASKCVKRHVIAVAPAGTLADLYEEAGAVVVERETETSDIVTTIAAAVWAAGSDEIILLPNGLLTKTELISVEKSSHAFDTSITILRTGSLLKGLVALAVHDPHQPLAVDAYAMGETVADIQTAVIEDDGGERVVRIENEIRTVTDTLTAAAVAASKSLIASRDRNGAAAEQITVLIDDTAAADFQESKFSADLGIDVVSYHVHGLGALIEIGVE